MPNSLQHLTAFKVADASIKDPVGMNNHQILPSLDKKESNDDAKMWKNLFDDEADVSKHQSQQQGQEFAFGATQKSIGLDDLLNNQNPYGPNDKALMGAASSLFPDQPITGSVSQLFRNTSLPRYKKPPQ